MVVDIKCFLGLIVNGMPFCFSNTLLGATILFILCDSVTRQNLFGMLLYYQDQTKEVDIMINNRINSNFEPVDIACSAEFSSYGCQVPMDDDE